MEDVEGYTPGGFHPVHLGNVFNERYKILHKLGYGDFSTVWLARDKLNHRYIALKILRADESTNPSELETLQRLESSSINAPGRRHVAFALDNFKFEGPNGKHLCLVFEVAGPSVANIKDSLGMIAGSRRMRADMARKIANQAIDALKFVHSQGVCHGDVTTSNVLFKLNESIDEWPQDELYQRYGKPRIDPVFTVSCSKPGDSVPR